MYTKALILVLLGSTLVVCSPNSNSSQPFSNQKNFIPRLLRRELDFKKKLVERVGRVVTTGADEAIGVVSDVGDVVRETVADLWGTTTITKTPPDPAEAAKALATKLAEAAKAAAAKLAESAKALAAKLAEAAKAVADIAEAAKAKAAQLAGAAKAAADKAKAAKEETDKLAAAAKAANAEVEPAQKALQTAYSNLSAHPTDTAIKQAATDAERKADNLAVSAIETADKAKTAEAVSDQAEAAKAEADKLAEAAIAEADKLAEAAKAVADQAEAAKALADQTEAAKAVADQAEAARLAKQKIDGSK